jgi:inner membrane transporter RhtA
MISLVLSRRLATESAGVDDLAVAVAAAAFVTLPAAVPAAMATRTTDDPGLVAAVALLGLAVPFGLEYIALRAVSVRTFGVLLSLDPAIAALAGAVWLGQRLRAADVAGIGLVVVASAGAMGSRGANERR